MVDPRPSEVYKLTKEETLKRIRAWGYIIIGFRVPVREDIYLSNSYNPIAFNNTHSGANITSGRGFRLILEALNGNSPQ